MCIAGCCYHTLSNYTVRTLFSKPIKLYKKAQRAVVCLLKVTVYIRELEVVLPCKFAVQDMSCLQTDKMYKHF